MATVINFEDDIQINTAIFNVPMSMYYKSPRVYEPKLVKIGAMQESKYNTTMERYKLAVVKQTIKEYFDNNSDNFLNFLVENSEKIASMYDYPNFYQSNTTAIDAAFVAWFIKAEKDQFQFIEHNSITIMLDLILMKNQIPLILIMKMLEKTTKLNPKKLFESIFISLSPFGYARLKTDYTNNIHLLACFYSSMVPKNVPEKGMQCKRLFTASKLQSYGIKFRAVKDLLPEKPTFTSIEFDKTNRTLILPRIVMYHERTEIVLKNLLAYEMVYSPAKIVKDYVLFMDYLVDSVEDLQILIDADIIENKMGSDENAIQLWNTICIGMTTEFCPKLTEIIDDLHEHCHKFKYRLLKESYDKFFSRPWLVISLITAIIITAATIIQTIYSAMSYYPH